MKNKRPYLKLTVGAVYLAYNIPTEEGNFNPLEYEETIKSEVVKSIGTTENSESTTVKSSGIDYKTVSQQSTTELAMEVVALSPEDIARLRAEFKNENGLVQSGRSGDRPFVALGFPIMKTDGGLRYVWYPKCQLVENTDDIATSEESFSEQNDTLTFRAYAYNAKKDIKNYVDNEILDFAETLTEEAFFTKPIIDADGLDSLLNGDGLDTLLNGEEGA